MDRQFNENTLFFDPVAGKLFVASKSGNSSLTRGSPENTNLIFDPNTGKLCVQPASMNATGQPSTADATDQKLYFDSEKRKITTRPPNNS